MKGKHAQKKLRRCWRHGSDTTISQNQDGGGSGSGSGSPGPSPGKAVSGSAALRVTQTAHHLPLGGCAHRAWGPGCTIQPGFHRSICLGDPCAIPSWVQSLHACTHLVRQWCVCPIRIAPSPGGAPAIACPGGGSRLRPIRLDRTGGGAGGCRIQGPGPAAPLCLEQTIAIHVYKLKPVHRNTNWHTYPAFMSNPPARPLTLNPPPFHILPSAVPHLGASLYCQRTQTSAPQTRPPSLLQRNPEARHTTLTPPWSPPPPMLWGGSLHP